MALTGKGSRRIVVDGVAYRWRLRRKPTYSQGMCWSPCTYAVELDGRKGAVLVVRTNDPHPSNWMGRPAVPVTPAKVECAVREALARGWRPVVPGPSFDLDLSEGFAES